MRRRRQAHIEFQLEATLGEQTERRLAAGETFILKIHPDYVELAALRKQPIHVQIRVKSIQLERKPRVKTKRSP